VVVNKGVRDPDIGEDLSGRQGWVAEIDSADEGILLVLIYWDSKTLEALEEVIIEQSEIGDGSRP
jgi:hypothetical protein